MSRSASNFRQPWLRRLTAASTLALLAAQPASAHEIDDRSCLDAGCTLSSLFHIDKVEPGSGKTDVSFGAWGFDVAGMDRSVPPGTDFTAYAGGTWQKMTEIPADRSRYGMFDLLRERSTERLHAIMNDIAADKVQDPDAPKLKALWQSFLDEARIERLDAKPIEPKLKQIADAKSLPELFKLAGENRGKLGPGLFGVGVSEDRKNPDVYALYMSQGGLRLPDRSYYLTAQFAEKKAKYEAYIADLLKAVNYPDAEAAAKKVVAFETTIAEASWDRAARRDADKTYNPISVADLAKQTPEFPWKDYLTAAGVGTVDRVIVAENTAVQKIAKIYASADLDTLKAWLTFGTVDQAAPLLSKRFVDRHFQFRLKELGGQPEQRVRWKRATEAVDNWIGEAAGRIYVARHFPADSKERMQTLVANLKLAMKARIEGSPWMSAETKAKAQEKLSKFGVKVGYPDKWRDYSALTFKGDDLYGNAERAATYEWNYRKARIGKPSDPLEWGMTPPTVNAYYSSTKNEIVFPAGILQAPYFDPKADDAINYGGIGGVIGHEITHGFDDQGRKSDGDGRLVNWWTDEDAARFQVEADRLGAQYEAFDPIQGAKINGKLTMGENIADLGGLKAAFDAYKLSLNGKPAPVLDGFTGEQRLFLGWSQIWRDKIRDDELRQRLATDPHSPARFRILGPIRNIDAWYDAFGVKEGDPLFIPADKRVRVW